MEIDKRKDFRKTSFICPLCGKCFYFRLEAILDESSLPSLKTTYIPKIKKKFTTKNNNKILYCYKHSITKIITDIITNHKDKIDKNSIIKYSKFLINKKEYNNIVIDV